MTSASTTRPARTVRKDVIRNRALLLAAADELFRDRGVAATLDEIALKAGVGVATAYRHFDSKQSLLRALFEGRIADVEAVMLAAEAQEDPREALEALIYGVAEMQSRDQGLRAVMAANHGLDTTSVMRQKLAPISLRVFKRAKQANLLRPEADPLDIPMILWTAGSIADYAEGVSTHLWRRYVDLLLDGLLAEGLPRRPINIKALNEPELDTAMANWQRPG